MERADLFHNVKYCSVCRYPLPMDYIKDTCPICQENELFGKVKEFIRENDVTEYDVVDKFGIPLHKVKNWIREGRIEYKMNETERIQEHRCLTCGVPISFGSYCQQCYKIKMTPKATQFRKREKEKMRYLDEKGAF